MAKNDHIKPVTPAPGPQPKFNHPDPFPARKPIPVEKKRVQVMRITDPMVAMETRRAAIVQELSSYGKAADPEQEVMSQAQEKVKANKRARQRAGTAALPQKQFTKSVHGTPQKSIIPKLDDNTAANLRDEYAAKHSELKTNLKTARTRLDAYGPGSGRHEDYQEALKAYKKHRSKVQLFKAKVETEESLKNVSTVRRSDDTSAPAGWGKGDDASDWQNHPKLSTSQMGAQLPAKPPVYAPGHKFAVVAKVKRQISAPDSGPSEVNTVRVRSTTKGIGPKTIAPDAALEQGVTPLIKNNLIGRRARLEAEFRPQNTSGEN